MRRKTAYMLTLWMATVVATLFQALFLYFAVRSAVTVWWCVSQFSRLTVI